MITKRHIRLVGVVAVLLGISFMAWSTFGRSDEAQQQAVLTELGEVAASIPPPAPNAPDDFPAIIDSAVRDPETNSIPVGATFEIIEQTPHDTTAFTQGLEFDGDRLFESTGIVGESTLREIDPTTGAVLRSIAVDDVFAEGLTVVDDTLIQLTWQNGIAYRYDIDTFEQLDTYAYEGQGWGLCDDGDRLVMSDGSPTLQFRDRDSFELISTIDVEFNNSPVDELNELECVAGKVWANIWKSSLIIEIDPLSGKVSTVLNARSLTPPSVEGSNSNVLNGIAYDDRDDTYLITGKRWPTMYRVRIDAIG
ncbi:MAG: glutaminyl-peptide cyclotransferase [Acidimicrobiia bacterium]|nr:glutaminyl-peptide cyclotransferase [Acidimicrobiia bacterium]